MHPIFDDDDPADLEVVTAAPGPKGSLPLTPADLLRKPSGDLFGWTQDVGMGWQPDELRRPEVLILSTQGGIRAAGRQPRSRSAITPATGKSGLLMRGRRRGAARGAGCMPFAGFVTDPCDGRTQGTTGMMDSLPYRNDAAMVLRPADPIAADAARRDRRGDLRQGPAGDDDGARRRRTICPA